MSLINKIKEKIKKRKQEQQNTYKPIFRNLKIESDGHVTRIYLDGVEQQYVTKIALYQSVGEQLELFVIKDNL